MSQPTAEVGFYGKLPFKGDFLQRRVPQEFVETWDAWLQQCMHESRQQLQEQWLAAYLTGPIWRFAFADGVCGVGAYAGILVPSVDRVGRYFPLTVVTRLDAKCCPLDVACGAARWFEAAESVALDALEAADMDVDGFDDQIGKLTQYLPADGEADASAPEALPGNDPLPSPLQSWRVPLAAAAALQRTVNVFAYSQLTRLLDPLALWWSDGSNDVEPCWLSTRGLPDARGFAAMLSAKAPEPI